MYKYWCYSQSVKSGMLLNSLAVDGQNHPPVGLRQGKRYTFVLGHEDCIHACFFSTKLRFPRSTTTFIIAGATILFYYGSRQLLALKFGYELYFFIDRSKIAVIHTPTVSVMCSKMTQTTDDTKI